MVDKAELRFSCTAFLLNEIHLVPTTFLVVTSCSFTVMSRTRCGRTDGHTDGRSGDYYALPSGSIKTTLANHDILLTEVVVQVS